MGCEEWHGSEFSGFSCWHIYPRLGAKDKKLTKICNERGDVSREPTDIKRIIQLQTHTFNIQDEMDQVFRKKNLSQLIQYEIGNLNTTIIIKEIEFII